MTYVPDTTFCKSAESITHWKCVRRKCRTSQLSRVAEIRATPTSSATKENTYLGRVGNSEATFRLRFDLDGRVSGSYTQGGVTYRLEGRNPSGRLELDEYTGDRFTAHLDLTLNSSEREVRWEGRMQNVYPNTNTYPVFFVRSR
jgi:hypothetical protein